MGKEKQEEAHNSQKDNQFPSTCLDSCFIQKSLKISLFFKPLFLWHFIFICIFCCAYFLFHYWDYLLFLKDSENFFNHSLILTSYDSYFYAKGAKEFLESLNIAVPYLSILAGIFAKIFGLDNVLVWSSVAFSVSFGIVLYGICFFVLEYFEILTSKSNQIFAFLGAFLGAFAPHFYQRTGAGYFDTDMLLLSLPLFAIFCLWLYIIKQKFHWLALFGFLGFLSVNWHNGIQNILLAGFLLYLGYEGLFFCVKRYFKTPILEISSVFLIVLAPSNLGILFLALALLMIKTRKMMIFCFLIACAYAYFFGLFNPLIAQIKAYLFGEIQYSSAYIYASVVDSILETSSHGFETLVQRSGGWLLFVLGLMGFLCFGFYFVLKRHNFIYLCIFLFPFLLLGFASLELGVRFSLFLAPILAFGVVLFFAGILDIMRRFLKTSMVVFAGYVALFLATLEYSIPKPILTNQEIESLQSFCFLKDDIVFSWWDYGYALEYFTKAEVLLDGGLHSGSINYPIAEILMNKSPILARNFSLILAQKMQNTPKNQWKLLFEQIIQENKSNPSIFLDSLQKKDYNIRDLPKGEVYWVLPKRIMPLVANIHSFRNINLQNGKRLRESVFVYGDMPLKSAEEYFVFSDFYIKRSQDGIPLVKVFWEGREIVMDFEYLKSNLVQWLIFRNNPAMNLVFENDFVVVYQVRK
ncbi:MAG TPA: peptide transporter [Candidatus Scatomorpha intestinipullorum]|nr:peptide transporter [Candidatus Scatomorpha intestinipullorum]